MWNNSAVSAGVNSKAKAKAKAAEVKPVVKPNVVTLKPLNIIQPVEICQTFKAEQCAYVEPEPVVPVVHKCSVKKAQRFFGILALLVLALTAVAALVLFPEFTNARIVAYSTVSCGQWTRDDWILYIGTFLGSVAAVSILVRWFLHSIGCKAKRRNKRCCRKCETYKFMWTFAIISAAGFLGLAAANLLGFNNVRDNLLEVVNSIFANGFTFTNPKHLVGAMGLGILVAIFVLLVLFSLGHKAKDKKRAKYSA